MAQDPIAAMTAGWPLAVQWLVAALLVLGGLFCLLGALGLLRFGDFFMRLHAPTKATTLGVGGLLLASILSAWMRGQPMLHELLITLFLFVTAPVSAHLMAQAALHLGLRPGADDRAQPPKPPPPPSS